MAKIRFNSDMGGVSEEEIARYQTFVTAAHEQLHSGRLHYTGWVDYPQNISEELIADIEKTAEKIKQESDVLVVIGIGGSYLGAKSAIELLSKKIGKPDTQVVFAGWNLSGTYHAQLINEIKNKDISLCVVSKSGTTRETSTAFEIFKKVMRKKYGAAYTRRIYAITDEFKGSLREECEAYGYKSFVLEADIGGRYSVLTPAGLLPIAVADIDIRKIIKGAMMAQAALFDESLETNIAYRYAVIRRLMDSKGMLSEIYCYNEPSFEYFAEWLKQLFGESEGKENKGILPSSVLFTRDLHSLGQYLQQGQHFFFETMIKLESPMYDISLGDNRMTYNEINDTVLDAVMEAHLQSGTPILQFNVEDIGIDDIGAETYGYMVYFFEKACAMSCLLLGVDPFDQPGVEVYKNKVRQLLHEE